MERRFLALAAGAAMLVSVPPTAGAGDFLASPDAMQWGGFYIGGQIGGAWSDTGWHNVNNNWFNTLGPARVINNFDIDAGGGFLGGGQAGYNFQNGPWVFGVEGSIAGTDLEGTIRSPVFPASDRYTTEISWLTTVTGRVGYAWDRWLAYGKGGWAGADIDLDLFDQGTPVRARSSSWAGGYTLGGGAEYAFGNNFSLGVEYAYVDLDTGNFTVSCPTCPPGIGGGVPVVDGDIEIQSVTGRLNYRFGR
jgi:outer membrane immunogenic protein